MHTLDHLAGVANRAAIHYTGESQLREVGQGRIHTYKNILTLFFVELSIKASVYQLAFKDVVLQSQPILS